MAQIHVPATLVLPLDGEGLTTICQRYAVAELSLFGSVLRPDFSPQSDVDVLVSFLPGIPLTLFWLGGLTADLEALFQRGVDLVHRPALRPFLAEEILSTQEVIYVQAAVSHELGLPIRHR